jgi:phytoene dehydrogenase-like protein
MENSTSIQKIGTNEFDVIVVGGGHNGLVAAGYLAKAGRKVLVLEKRQIVGGAAVTEEFFPGFKFSSLADGSGSLSPKVASDLKLSEHGLQVLPTDPLIVSLLDDGKNLTLWHDTDRTAQEIAEFSTADAQSYPKFIERMGKISRIVAEMNHLVPPDVPDLGLTDLTKLKGFISPVRSLGWRHISQVVRLLPMSVADLLNEWFESEYVIGAIAASAILNTSFGPQEINSTAYAFLRSWSLSNNGLFRSSGQVKGGMGALTQALADAAQSAGASILTESEIATIDVQDGKVSGVTLADGDQYLATKVISAADMRTTFLKLIDPYYLDAKFVESIRNIKYRGTLARMHFALDRLPTFAGIDGDSHRLSGHVQIAPTIEYLQKASDAAKFGHHSKRSYLDFQIPTLTDPSLAPEGKHILSATVKYMPYSLRDGSWGALRGTVGKLVVDTLSGYAPDFKECILHEKLMTPLEIEQDFSLPEGCPVHGDMALNQFMWMRPIPGYAQYRGPIDGLYLCSAATHPGGGVTGINGKNAAQQVLSD